MKGLLARARSFWRALRSPAQVDAEMDEEMRFHIEMESERLVREQGLDPKEARRLSAIAFGGVDRYKEEVRDVRGLGRARGLSLDLKLARRMLTKSPGLTVVGVLGLALGTAVGIGSFVVLSNFFYPDLPLDEGERIVALSKWDVETTRAAPPSMADVLAWRGEMRSVQRIAAASLGYRRISGDAPLRTVRAAEMTAEGFQVARVPPLLGRYLVAEDEREGVTRVAVIGYDLWQARFQGDSDVVGRRILVDDVDHVVVGVMPPGFAFPESQELWTPLRTDPTLHEDPTLDPRGEGPELFVFGRLAPGATPEQAQAELTAVDRRAAAAAPESNGRLRPRVLPYTYPLDDVGDVTLREAATLQLMVILLLIAVAVNIAILVYARTAMRQGEIALRAALGASRRRIVGQLSVEALLLSLLGAGLGLGLAHAALLQMEAIFGPEATAFWVDYGLQPRSVAIALVLAVLSAVVVGVLPGLKSTGRRLQADLRRMGSGASVRLGRGWTALIVAQVAVAVALLPTAVHFGYQEIRLGAVRATFSADDFLTARVGPGVPIEPGMDGEAHRRESAARFAVRLPELERRLEAEPAVAGVTIEGSLPGRGRLVEVEGASGPGVSGALRVLSTGVAPDYFETLGARVLTGRALRASDADESAAGLAVSEAFVRRVLGEGPALGRRVRFLPRPGPGEGAEQGLPGPWLEIVGVVDDLYASAVDREVAPPTVYYAVAPGQLAVAELLVRVRDGETADLAPRLREITTALDPDLWLGSVGNLATMRTPRYVTTAVVVILFVLSTVLLLSAAGIHALMSLTVTRRRKEIGIRAALGARPGRVLASVFSRAAGQLGLGALVGSLLGGALLFGNGVTGRSAAVSLGAVVVLLLAAGLVAAGGPAGRGLRIPPMEALREE